MELNDYLRVLRKNWILIVAFTLVGVAAGAVLSITATPKFEATTKLYVSVRTTSGDMSGELVQGGTFARQAVTSYVDVVTSAEVLSRVIDELDLDTTPAILAGSLSASSPADTVLIQITASSADPEKAADLANSVGENTRIVVAELEKPDGKGASPVKIETIQPAVAPTAASSPRVPVNIVLGVLLGFAVGFGAAVLRTVLDTRLHTSADVERVTDKPILGGIAFDPDSPKRPLVVQVDPMSAHAEAYRSLRTNLQFVNVGDGPRSFVVTSSVPGEGKSTTVTNLAVALAETGAKVVLVEGDLRRPKIAGYMGLEGAVGVTDVLIGQAQLKDVLQRWGDKQLYVLPSGRIPPNPSELLGSHVMSNLLDTLHAEFDYVLIDAPPLLLVTDAAVLSRFTGGVLLMAASGRTKYTELAAAVRAIDHVGSRLLGVIVTMVPTKGPDSYGYGQYGYAVQHEESTPAGPSKRRRA